MTLFTASDARRRFRRLLKTARRKPVTITKNGRVAAMMLSASDSELISLVRGFVRSATGARGSLMLSAGAVSEPRRVNAH